MEKILDELYRLSSDIHGVLNGIGQFSEELCCSRGKLYTSREEAYAFWNNNQMVLEAYDEDGSSIGSCSKLVNENDSLEMRDCRSPVVDAEIKDFVKRRINRAIVEFYEKRTDDDEFLLFLGFSMNIYYIVGLYSVYGKYDLKEISYAIKDHNIRSYVSLMNDFLYSLIVDMVCENVSSIRFSNLEKYKRIVNEKRGEYIECIELEEVIEEVDHNLAPDICMVIGENNFECDSDEILEKMILEYSEYRFAWVYKCLEAAKGFYQTKGKDISVYQYRSILGTELYYHILGIEKLDSGKIVYKDGTFKTIRPAIFSEFGIGIPVIKPVSEHESRDMLNSWIQEEMNGKERKKVLIEDVRNKTKSVLGVNTPVDIKDNPMSYMVKFFELLENQKEELIDKNNALDKMQKERKNMIAHLAHSWGNECYPEIVKNVADELLRKGNNSLANRLFKAYNSENNLMGEIIFLQAAMEESSDALQKIFKDGFVESGAGKRENKVYHILNQAIEIYIFGLMNDKSEKEKRIVCKNRLCKKMSLSELMADYAKRFEENIGNEVLFLDWFSEKVFPISISLDDVWQEINFGRTEYGKVVFKNIITELFTNVLFHGDDACEIKFYSDAKKMYISVINKIAKDGKKGSEKGLIAMRELVSKLNFGTGISENDGVVWKTISEGKFETQITLDKGLMYIEEW